MKLLLGSSQTLYSGDSYFGIIGGISGGVVKVRFVEKLLWLFASVGVMTVWYYVQPYYQAWANPVAPWEIAGMYAIPSVVVLLLVSLMLWRLKKRE